MRPLFDDIEAQPELPEGLIDIEMNNIEALVLKTLVFIDYPLSKTETGNVLNDIIKSVVKYRVVKTSSVTKAINSLVEKDLVLKLSNGIQVNPHLYDRILPLAKDNKELIKASAEFFRNRYYYEGKPIAVKLYILCGDFEGLDRLTSISTNYSWSDAHITIRNGLISTGDVTKILPLLPSFHSEQKELLLKHLPISVHYAHFEQLKQIYLSPDIRISKELKYLYASCASLILPVDEVLEISQALKLEAESMFYLSFLKGDNQLAIEQAGKFIVKIQAKYKHKRKELPGVYGLLYALVLLRQGGAQNLTIAATYLRSATKQIPVIRDVANPFKSFTQIVLLFINHKLGKKTISLNEIFSAFENCYHQQFLTAVLNWFGKPMTKSEYPGFSNEKEEFEYRAAGLKAHGDSTSHETMRLKELRDKFKVTPLAEICQPVEAWEDLLTILNRELSSVKESDKKDVTPEKKLAWLVNPFDNESLVCLEQNKTKNGWSKGKKRSLLRLLSSAPAFATEADKQVISCLQKHGYYNDVYIRNWEKLLKILAKHTEVYTHNEPYLPLKIRIQDVEVKVDKHKNGIALSLQPSEPDESTVQETATSYILYNWSKQAHQIRNIIADTSQDKIIIPENGIERAKPILEQLNGLMPVKGNWVKNSAQSKKSDCIPVIQLTPVDNSLHIQLQIELINGEEVRFTPGIGSTEVLVTTKTGKHYNVKRNKAQEKELMLELSRRLTWFQELSHLSAQLFIDDDAEVLDFLSEVKEKAPEIKLIWPKGEKLKVAKAISYTDLNIDVKQTNDWFALNGEVYIDENMRLTIQELLQQSKGGSQQYIQLDDKTYLSICKELQKRLAALDSVSSSKGKTLLVHPLGSNCIEQFIDGVEDVKTDKHWKQHIKNLDALKQYQPTLATNLQAELRPYQEEGVLWLDRLHNWGVGACLADDMGLGKTIQTISMLLKYAHNGASLVLAPSSVCNNWVKEIHRFSPTLNPVLLKNGKRQETLDALVNNDVLIFSYGLLQANPELLQQINWNMVVLDEAHAIKNAQTVRSKAVMKLKANFRIITTGTPIQNHLGELWNLFQFINPGMLGSSEQFNEKYVKGNGEKKDMRKALNRYISPFILRRNKNEVLDDLPPKTEIAISVTLSDEERAMYEELRQQAIMELEDINSSAKHMQVLAHITKLRQMSCHPQLVAPKCGLSSSKLEALENLVDDLLRSRHKALVFSQFTKHLVIIKTMLDKKGISYQYLDGSTPIKVREKAINSFQNGESDLFLISLKAGGVGLNLTAADYVIHMDPWWNPAIEDQASDRVHRIGQQRPVTIYRLIAENTIEEKIVKMHHEKRSLADKLLADTDQSAKISSEELMALITEQV